MDKQHSGFTLIELMTAIGIVAILAALAVPGFREYTRNTRVTAKHNDLVTAFTVARSEALRRSQPVSVCASADGVDCSDDADDWQTGWLVFVDATGTAGEFDAGDELVQAWDGVTGEMVLDASDPFIQYLPSGLSLQATSMEFDVSWSSCAGPYKRRLTVNAIGSLSTAKVDC
jgi:type IV fimbrial biogenesis protein FimT